MSTARFARGARLGRTILHAETMPHRVDPDLQRWIERGADHPDARAIAESHRNKTWARRWLKQRGRL